MGWRMKNKLGIWVVCLFLVGVILIGGCTQQFQGGADINNTTGPELNASTESTTGGPPTPKIFTPKEEVPSVPK